MKLVSLSLVRKMAGQGNSKVACANLLHIVFASSDAHPCMGSYYIGLISCFKCEYMLRAHEHLIILGAFARAGRVSTPLQSATSFFTEILCRFLHVVLSRRQVHVCVLPPTRGCHYTNCSSSCTFFVSSL